MLTSKLPLVELRPYQREAVEAALQAKRGTIKAATGTGKTVMAIEWIKSLDTQTLIIVPTQALIYQSWVPKLQEAGLMDVGQYYAYAKTSGPVMITTYSSVMSHPDLIEKAQAIVLDEIHHLGASTALRRILPAVKSKEFVLGLSSIPEREDEMHRFFLREFPICFDLSLSEAMREKIVAPLEVIRVPAEMTLLERKKYDTYTEKIQRAFKTCGPDITSWGRFYDQKTRQFVGRAGLLSMIRRKKLLSKIESKKEEVAKIIEQNKGQMVIVFSESVEAIEDLKQSLLERGISSETFHSKTEPWRRMEILENWGPKFDVLLSCRALEEGLDVKEVSIGILMTSGKSKRQFVQRIGRVIRPKQDKVAKFYVVHCPRTIEESYIRTIESLLRRN
jgi:superfamily II DNA or RNA helicase